MLASQDSASPGMEERLALALDATGAGLWELDLATGRVSADRRWWYLLGRSSDELGTGEEAWEALCHPDDLRRCKELRSRALAGEAPRYECEIRIRGRDGGWSWRVDSCRLAERASDGSPSRLIGTLVDIDKRKRAELASAERGSRLLCLLDSLDDFVLFKDREGKTQGCNRAFERFLGKPASEIVGRVMEELYPPDFAAAMKAQDEGILRLEESIKVEEWYREAGGSRILLEMKKSPLRDEEGRTVGVAVIARDVTERHDAEALTAARLSLLVEAESKLRESVAEKEALIRELYHRTKNSMQLINAMLELKKVELGPSAEAKAFEEIQDKIIAMSLVQEKIYQAGSFAVLDLGDYLRDLVRLLERDATVGPSAPAFRLDLASVPVSVDTAVPCGIVVSELVGNCLRHAFPAGARGSIDVALSSGEDEEICLRVADDGKGAPRGFDPRAGAKLGLRTVIGIGEEQLRGTVRFGEGSPGFSVSLRFKDRSYPKRLSAEGRGHVGRRRGE